MKKLIFIFIACCPALVNAQQNCEGSFSEYLLNSNHISAVFYPRGNKFFNGEGGFMVPFPSDRRLSTIFASSVWIGGFDDADNFKQAAETWPQTDKYDFSVGPLTSIGIQYDSICQHYDQAWTVFAEDIEAHRLDFFTDYKIDDTIPSVFGWPGRGNKFFKSYYGFDLPNDNQGLAPFDDWNGNNIYDPENGDYPCVRFSPYYIPIVPNQILWMVFNDVDQEDTIFPRPLQFEIQLTAFAFHCKDNELLNNTIFNSYKIINRAVIAADSLFFGLWTDYDLGCASDDLMGSDSARSTEFVYNAHPSDGDVVNACTTGSDVYTGIAPVQSMTYLSHPMHSFILYAPESGHFFDKYRMLNGFWDDGKPIRPEGTGYAPGSSLLPTKFLFNGDPRDSASWSANHVYQQGFNPISVSSVSIGRMDPGTIKVIENAYIYSHDPNGGYLDQITAMYNNVDSLKTLLSTNFDQPCTSIRLCSGTNCVWPGDFDHNNIADHRDILTWGLFKDYSGSERNGLISWRGHYGEDWNGSASGINAKHGDGNGNGKVEISDLEINAEHFRYTNRYYQGHDTFPEGPELVLSSNPMNSDGRIRSISVKAGIDLQNVLGLAYELDYDTSLYDLLPLRLPRCPADSNIICYGTGDYYPIDPEFSVTPTYAFVTTNHQPLSIPKGFEFDRMLGGLWLRPNVKPEDVPDTVIIRLKNIVAIDPNGNDLHFGSNTLKVPNNIITGITNLEQSPSLVRIYPNPADQSISIETELESNVLIFNLQGQMIKKVIANDIHDPIDISLLSAGLYFLQFTGIGGTYKFVKQ